MRRVHRTRPTILKHAFASIAILITCPQPFNIVDQLRGVFGHRFYKIERPSRNDFTFVCYKQNSGAKRHIHTSLHEENGMDLGLRGKKAIVTGASSGIGRAAAKTEVGPLRQAREVLLAVPDLE